jgi:hypothetical protein
VIVEDGRDIGRLYEDRHVAMGIDPKLVMNTSGRAATLDEAKAQFLRNWQKCQQRPKRDH